MKDKLQLQKIIKHASIPKTIQETEYFQAYNKLERTQIASFSFTLNQNITVAYYGIPG